MKRLILSSRLWRMWIPGGSVLLLGGCGMSDAQLASIWQSVIQTALTTGLTQLLSALSAGTVAAT